MSRSILSSPLELNQPVDPRDPFPYGWRFVRKGGRNGSEKMVKLPLTLEDILHPQEEDFRLWSDPHTEDCYYLRGAFRMALANTPGTIVLNDFRVAWDRAGDYGHGPDCAVIFKVRKKELWSTFNVVKEKTRPALIVEVTSPSTRSTDLVDKVREYAEQKVPHCVIADARERADYRQVSFIDYHLAPKGRVYYSLPTNEDGRVWLPEV
jgi:colicin import membrane protein